MNIIPIAKLVLPAMSSWGILKVVGSVGAQHAAGGSTLTKACIAVGSFAVSGMIAEKAEDYINDQIDKVERYLNGESHIELKIL